MKRTLSLVLSLIMVLGIFISMPVTVNAETIHTYGDFKYTILSDGTIEIVDYTGGSNVIIPPIINGYTVSSIGKSAFSRKYLSRVEIHYGITTIKDYAFSYNSNLTSVHIPNSVQSFGYMVFMNSLDVVVCCHDGSYIDEIYNSWKSNLSHTYTSDYHIVKAPTCTTTGQKAKYCIYCGIKESTQTINSLGHTISDWIIDENATCIEAGSKRKECTVCGETIENTTIPATGHNSINGYCTDCDECFFEYIVENNSVTITGYTGTDTDIVIPSVIDGLPVTSIGDYAFDGCGNIVSVTIPEGVVRIGDSAFSNNHSLNEVSLPKGIIDIGMSAFSATGITNNMQIRENGALYIDEYLIEVFEPSSENYVVKDGTVLIAGGAFAWTFTEDIQIKSIEIPSSVKYICDNAFSHCSSLCEIIIPSGVKTIGNAVFYNCTNLASIKIPDSVTNIGESAFAECKNITSLEIPRGITNIGKQTFYNCTNLISIVIPDSITTIGDYAFYCCPNLKYLFYSGSKECWNNIIKGSMNYILDDVYIHYNTTSHEPSDWIIDINPSCVDYGVKHIECSQCGLFMKEEIIPETGTHKPSDWIIDKNATCTQAGSKHKECTVCGESIEIETIPSFPHNPIEEIREEPTCSKVGLKDTWCEKCGLLLAIEEIPTLPHTSSDWIIDESATCTRDGTKFKKCLVCHKKIEFAVTPATGHNSSDWIIDTESTVSAPGSKHKECTECGEVFETEVIPQLKPATPKVATTNEIGGVKITWNTIEGAIKYNVYRRQGGSSSWIYVGTTTDVSFTDTKVTSGIYYVYSVRAYNNAGQYSDFVSTNTQTRKYMATPKLTTIYNHANGLAIKWNAVAGVTEGYRVYRRGAGSIYWTYLGTTKNLYFIDSAVKNKSGEYFRYTVIADGGYHSKFDTTGLYLKRLANPTLKSAVSSSAGITVKWGAVSGTTGYYVYRKTANSSWVRIAAVGGTNNTTYLDKTAKKGTTYTYTVRAVYGSTTSAYNSGISCYDKY